MATGPSIESPRSDLTSRKLWAGMQLASGARAWRGGAYGDQYFFSDFAMRFLAIGLGAALTAAGLLILAPLFLGHLIAEEADIRFVVRAQLTYDGELYEGAAVWEMHVLQAKILSHDMVETVRGEAIQLHGSGGRKLFLLRVHFGGGSSLSYGAFPLQCVPGKPRTNIELIENLREHFSGPCVVEKFPPMLVEIPDLDDPTSIVRVPYAAAIGTSCKAGTCLTDLRIERTSEPITIGLEQTLPWLAQARDLTTDVVTGISQNYNGRELKYNLMDFSTELDR